MNTKTYGAPSVSPGGEAIKFFPSLRLEFKRIDWIKKGEEPVGQKIRVKTVKNRFNSPYKVCEIDLIFGEGVDLVVEAVDVAIDKKIIEQGGAWFKFVDVKGQAQSLQGRPKVYDFYRASEDDFAALKESFKFPVRPASEVDKEEIIEDVDRAHIPIFACKS